MEPFELGKNITGALGAMKIQTGKEAGGQTGLCHLVVTQALTGASVDFTVAVNREKQIKIESESGLENYPIVVDRGILISDAVTALLDQKKVPFEALLLTGKVNNLDETHVIAVVPHSTTGDYSVVDSLIEGAMQTLPDPESVASFVNGRFDTITRPLSYSVVLTPEEQVRRRSTPRHEPVMIQKGIHI